MTTTRAPVEAPSGSGRERSEDTRGGGNAEPLHLLVEGMRQLQQVYMGRADAKDSEMKVGSAELPEMPPVGPESAVAFSDWLYETEQAVGGLSDKASEWFGMCLRLAQETYEVYQQSDPLARLSLEPRRSVELMDGKWSRLERRVLTMMLGTLQKAAKDDAVTHRISSVPALLFRLHVLYAPGSSSERAAILRQLEGANAGASPADTVAALRKWRRHLQRAEEMRVAVPDSSILLRGIEAIAGKAIEANQDVKFRLALSRNQLQLQYRPTYDGVLSYYNHVIAELQQAAPMRTSQPAPSSSNATTEAAKLKALGTNSAGTGDTTSPRRGANQASGKVPCRFFAGDNGCTKGSSCKFDHTFASKEAKKAKCWHCGAIHHTQKDCPVKAGRTSPTRPKASPQPTTSTSTAASGSGPSSAATLNQAAVQHQQALIDSLQGTLSSSASTTAPPATTSVGPVNSGAVSHQAAAGQSAEAEDKKTQEITALLQEANAMLNKLTRLQAIQVATDTSLQELSTQMRSLGLQDEERMALLDSGASHPFRERDDQETMRETPVRVDLAGGQSVVLQQNQAGTLLPTTTGRNPQDVSTILPLGALVQSLGCELTWTRRGGLKIVHPQFGTLKTVVRGNCPLLGETQALELIHQLEQRKLQELKKATAETFLQTMSDVKEWDELFALYVQTGERSSLLQALQAPGSPLQGLENQLIAMLAVDVDKSEEAGKKYLKAIPMRRAQRKVLLSRRWVVKLYERDGEDSEPFKVVETDKVVFLNVNVHRSRGFSMKGSSPMYTALMWAALRGQIEGIVGAPPSNSCVELTTKQLLLWMVAKEGARLHRQTSPYLAVEFDPNARWWTSTTWQGFQREYQIPVTQVFPTQAAESYCVATNLELCGGDDVGWGPGVEAYNKAPKGWSLSFQRMLAKGIFAWRRVPEPLMLCAARGGDEAMSPEELRRWKRHVANGHLPYNRRCRTCVETAATGRSHRRVIAPSCYTLSLDLCGPFRVKGETADAKGYRYALVGNYTMPLISGYKDYQIPEELLEQDLKGEEEATVESLDDGGGIGESPEEDLFEEGHEPEPEVSDQVKGELDGENDEYKKLFKEIRDTVQYQNLHYMIPLKTRTAPEVEAAIRLLYVQLRSEGLPLQRVHSDRARELRGQGIRRWLLERDVYPTTGEAQSPQSNGRAEKVVQMLKRRARTLLQTAKLPRVCWPLAMGHAAWAQRECALGRSRNVVAFGSHVVIKAKVFGQGGKFDLNNKWDNGYFVGPSTEVRGGYVVRDEHGRYLTTMHMKTDVLQVEEITGPVEAEACLPMPSTRLRRKVKVVQEEGDVPLPARDSGQRSSSSGPFGEVVVPTEGGVPLPARDSEQRSSSSGPSGEVVVPNMSEPSGSGPTGDDDSPPTPRRRLRGKGALMGMSASSPVQSDGNRDVPLTFLERDIEDMAVIYNDKEQYDVEAVLRIFGMLERTNLQGSKAVIRKSETDSTSWTTGMFTHGGVSGLRRTTRRMPETTTFMVEAAKRLTGRDEFGVVAITRGARLRAHRDSHNNSATENTVMALTEFKGGGIWVEGEGDQWREVHPGRWVQGKVHDLRLCEPVSFNPKKWHETQKFEGDRVVLMTYTPRTTKLKQPQLQQLQELGFVIPRCLDEGVSAEATHALEGQEYILDSEGVLESLPVEGDGEEEGTLSRSLLRLNEIQQSLIDEMMDRSSLLQDLLEEEDERLKDLHDVQQEGLDGARQVHGEIMQMLETVEKGLSREQRVRDECLLKAVSVNDDIQDYEKLLAELEGDLQVTHTVPLQQVKPVVGQWRPAIEKELGNLFEKTGTLKRIKMSEARRMEAEGRLRLVPSKGVFTIKPPAEKGQGFKRKYRLVLCGNFIDPADSCGSLYAGGVGAETLRTLLAATSRRGWRGATTDLFQPLSKQSGQLPFLFTRLFHHGYYKNLNILRMVKHGWYVVHYMA